MTKFCGTCGTATVPGDRFCQECGRALEQMSQQDLNAETAREGAGRAKVEARSGQGKSAEFENGDASEELLDVLAIPDELFASQCRYVLHASDGVIDALLEARRAAILVLDAQNLVISTHRQMLIGEVNFDPSRLRDQMDHVAELVETKFVPTWEKVARAVTRDFRGYWLPGMSMPNLSEEQAFMNFTRRYQEVVQEYFNTPIDQNNMVIHQILAGLPEA